MGPLEEISRRIASPRVVLPEPDSPTMPSVSPAPHLDAHAVHRLDVADDLAQHAALDREPDLEIVGPDDDVALRIERRRLDLGLGGEERARIGMLRRVEHLLDRSLLDDLALLHHADPFRDPADDAEVMGDEQDRHAEARLQVLEKLENLRLHGDVERSGRLVRDQEIRLVGERHRDHDALALAARELVRIALQPALRIRDAAQGEQLDDPRPRRPAGDAAMQQQDFSELLFDGVERIERRHRLLEHDGDVAAAMAPDLAIGEAKSGPGP